MQCRTVFTVELGRRHIPDSFTPICHSVYGIFGDAPRAVRTKPDTTVS